MFAHTFCTDRQPALGTEQQIVKVGALHLISGFGSVG